MSRELFDMDCIIQKMLELIKSSNRAMYIPLIVKCLLSLCDLNGSHGEEF